MGYQSHVLISLKVNVQHNTYQIIRGYSHTCRSGLITCEHRFVYLICGNTGDTTGKICWMKGIHLLPPNAYTGTSYQHRSSSPHTHACMHIWTNRVILMDYYAAGKTSLYSNLGAFSLYPRMVTTIANLVVTPKS